MKMKKIILTLALLIVLVASASALQYNVPLVDQNGNSINGNLDIVTFECTDTTCTDTRQVTGAQSFLGPVANYVFPTTSTTGTQRFRLHILTDDYLPQVLDLTVNGALSQTTVVNRQPVMLEQAQNCYAPTKFVNEVQNLGPGAPLIVNYKTTVTSDYASPFKYDYRITEGERSSNDLTQNAETKVVAKIEIFKINTDATKTLEKTEIRYHYVAPEEFESFEYIWTPKNSGNYEVVVTTTVDTSKCTSTLSSEGSSKFTVEPTSPENNACYTRIHNLQTANTVAGNDAAILLTGDVYSRRSTGSNPLSNYESTDATIVVDFGSYGKLEYNYSAADPIKFGEYIQLPRTDAASEFVAFNVYAYSNDASCTRQIPEGKYIEIERNDALPSTIQNVLLFSDIPDAIISDSVPEYRVDLNALTFNPESDAVEYKAFALGQSESEFLVTITDGILSVSLKELDSYFEAHKANVYVTASDTENKITRSFKIATPFADIGLLSVINAPQNVYVGTPAEFDGSLSRTDDGASIVSYEWNFGDSTPTQTGSSAVHTFFSEGRKVVQLKVTDSSGRAKISTMIVNVLPAINDVNVEPENFKVSRFIFKEQEVKTGDSISTVLSFTNDIGKDIKNVRIVLIIKELGLHQIIGPISIDDGDSWTRKVLLDVPKGTQPGGYYASLIISNGEFSRHKYNFVRLLKD